MSIQKKTLLVLLLMTVTVMLVAGPASATKSKPFIELSTGDLTKWCGNGGACLTPTGELYYERVDGLMFYLGAEYRSDTRLHPRVRGLVGWPSARDATYYKLHIEQPLYSQDSVSFGVDLYNMTDWSREDHELISDFGNNVDAFFARVDERDYFRREGVTVFAQDKVTSRVTLRLEYRADDLESLSTQQSVWSVLERDDDWRENPPLEIGVLAGAREVRGEAQMRSYVWSIAYDTMSEEQAYGWRVREFSEFGENLGGDYDFTRHSVDAMGKIRLTDTQSLTLEGRYGLGYGTDYPSQKLFYLGGHGTLRGYDLKEFKGKDMIFGRAEYLVQAYKELEMIFSLESGSVSYSSDYAESNSSHGAKSDAGIGFQVPAPWAGWVRLDFARAFESGAKTKTYLTLLLDS